MVLVHLMLEYVQYHPLLHWSNAMLANFGAELSTSAYYFAGDSKIRFLLIIPHVYKDDTDCFIS